VCVCVFASILSNFVAALTDVVDLLSDFVALLSDHHQRLGRSSQRQHTYNIAITRITLFVIAEIVSHNIVCNS
jgi:hypothetical protein